MTNTLSQLDTAKLHYVKVPENHIVIDFDILDDEGNKSLERNLESLDLLFILFFLLSIIKQNFKQRKEKHQQKTQKINKTENAVLRTAFLAQRNLK